MMPGGRPGLLGELRHEQQQERDRQRAVLREHAGMTFADEEVADSTADWACSLTGESQSKWEQDALRCEQLLVEGVHASSTDHQAQGIANTLDYRNVPQLVESFWSSTGSDTPDHKESLTYRLKYPISVVHSVRVQAYRALYQYGHPVYPAQRVMIEVGPSPHSLLPATGWMKMRMSSEPQTFHVPISSSAARYLRVVFWGKPQPQLEDKRYYIAIQRVQAFGWQVDPLHLSTYLHSAYKRPGTISMCNGAYLSAHMCGATRVIVALRDDRFEGGGEDGVAENPPVTSFALPPYKLERAAAAGSRLWTVPPLPPCPKQKTSN